MIIVLGSQKGGVGKSTLAVSIAAYLMSLGNRVIIVDADDQKSVLTWYNNRPEDLPHSGYWRNRQHQSHAKGTREIL